MNNDTAIKIKGLIAGIIGFVTELIGWQGWLFLLYIAAMVLDYITGTRAASANGKWDSEVAKAGLKKKGNTLSVVLDALLLDGLLYIVTTYGIGFELPLHGTVFTPVVLIWYIITESGSIVENVGKNGGYVPPFFRKRLKALQETVETVAGEDDSVLQIEHSASEDGEA